MRADDVAHGGARQLLTRRLADIVCLPSSRVTPQERWMVADVLEELLRNAEPDLRAKVARRLAEQAEAPLGLLRRLALDAYEIAAPILQRSQALSDFDMVDIAERGDHEHRLALARRETVTETVCGALASTGDEVVIAALLRNEGAALAPQTIDQLATIASHNTDICRLLIRRRETRPHQAFSLFWECDHDLRRMILERFSAGRSILQEAAADVFPLAAKEAVPDAAVAAALTYIDRRQRDRGANDESPLGGLEGVVEIAGRKGFDDALRREAARVTNIEPDLLDRIIDDFSGEPAAVLAKATGLSRKHFELLLDGCPHIETDAARENVTLVFDTLSVDKAQTVLRYWNWGHARVDNA
jgi:uncharacterized protein (DUF2336 family)